MRGYNHVPSTKRNFIEGHAWQHPNGRFYPAHAGLKVAAKLQLLASAMPRLSAGLLLDHLWQEFFNAGFQNSHITLVAMQGTGTVDLPISRLRFDYSQLGRTPAKAGHSV